MLTLSVVCGVSLFVGLIFGLAPVAVALRGELNDGLRSMKRIHLPSLLVTAEVALSLVLLAAAGLLMQSFLRMRGMATGIQSDQVSVLWLILNPHHYENFPLDPPSMTKRCAACALCPASAQPRSRLASTCCSGPI